MIGIVILNYMNWKVTENCVNSILKEVKGVDYHIYIVDNASPNSSPPSFKKMCQNSNITFIKNNINKGYSAGNNVGIKEALQNNCDAILISNSDIVFTENSVLTMYNFLKENSAVGIVGPKILKPNGDIQIPGMGIKTGIKEKYLINTPMRKIFQNKSKEFYCKEKDYDRSSPVHAVSGCCFMISRKCTLDITPFDENTFLFEEELIIGIVMEEKNYVTMYYPQTSVIHAHGQSTKNVKAFSFICFVESEIYYCLQYLNAKKIQIFPLYIIRTTSYILRAVKQKDFRRNMLNYFKSTWPLLFVKY